MTDDHHPAPDRRRWLPVALVVAAVIAGAAIIGAVLASGAGDPASTTDDAGGSPFPTLPTGAVAADDVAPDFTADLFDGTTFSLSEHMANDGRPVFLNLWASWCFPCREEMPAIDAVAARHPEIFFLGVAVEDDPISAEEFAEEIAVSYTLGIDERNRVPELYPALGLPATFFISEDGRVTGRLFGGASEETFESFIAGLVG